MGDEPVKLTIALSLSAGSGQNGGAGIHESAEGSIAATALPVAEGALHIEDLLACGRAYGVLLRDAAVLELRGHGERAQGEISNELLSGKWRFGTEYGRAADEGAHRAAEQEKHQKSDPAATPGAAPPGAVAVYVVQASGVGSGFHVCIHWCSSSGVGGKVARG